MTSRATRLRARRRHLGARPATSPGATDAVPGLGRVEQLVLRGDGLTTTSLEILTGDRITVVVDGHWKVSVPDRATDRLPGGTMHFDHDGPDVDGHLATGLGDLEAQPGESLLVREVLLVGGGRVHGSAEVVALFDLLPAAVTEALAATDQPIGRLLRDHGVQVTRELRRWGPLPASNQAARLGPGLSASSRVLGRTYVMRESATRRPLAALTERFAPHVFTGGG